MRTTKPFSTISYCSSTFLIQKLDDLVSRRKLSFYMFMDHAHEEDEKKDHRHLYIVPNGQIDTDQISDLLQEYDPQNPSKPLRCLPFRSSKFDDAYLYFTHNDEYLASKGQSRQHHYEYDQMITSDADYYLELIHQIDLTKFGQVARIIKAAEQGMTFTEFIKTQPLNLLAVRSAQFIFQQIQGGGYKWDELHRGSGETHE